MSGDEAAEGDEGSAPASYIRMSASETFDGQERVFSRAAYNLQCEATRHSARCGHPGFVPDDYLEHLNGLGVKTTIAAAIWASILASPSRSQARACGSSPLVSRTWSRHTSTASQSRTR